MIVRVYYKIQYGQRAQILIISYSKQRILLLQLAYGSYLAHLEFPNKTNNERFHWFSLVLKTMAPSIDQNYSRSRIVISRGIHPFRKKNRSFFKISNIDFVTLFLCAQSMLCRSGVLNILNIFKSNKNEANFTIFIIINTQRNYMKENYIFCRKRCIVINIFQVDVAFKPNLIKIWTKIGSDCSVFRTENTQCLNLP